MMQLIDVTHPALHSKISGIDRIFMAPEIVSGGEIGAKADVWSLGVMLYLLITGGIVDNNTDTVHFYFDEPVWGYFKDDLRLFVESCLEVEPSRRFSVKELEGHAFMQLYNDHKLDKVRQCEEEVANDEEINCYKLQVCSVLHEIVHRQNTFNTAKMKVVHQIEDDFFAI